MITELIAGLLVGVALVAQLWRALPSRPSLSAMGWGALAIAIASAVASASRGRCRDLALLLALWVAAGAGSSVVRAWAESRVTPPELPSGERKRAARPGGRAP